MIIIIILIRPSLEKNLVSNAIIKLNLTVAANLISNLFDNYVLCMSRNQVKKDKNEEI